MCVFIVRLKQPGLFGGSICHRLPGTSAVQADTRPSACRPDRGSVRLLFVPQLKKPVVSGAALSDPITAVKLCFGCQARQDL